MIMIENLQAKFDVSSVDNMRRLVEHAGVPGHIYPLALLCYDIMPPPAQVFLLFHQAHFDLLLCSSGLTFASLCRLKKKLVRKE